MKIQRIVAPLASAVRLLAGAVFGRCPCRPKTRDQKPRFFSGLSASSSVGGVTAATAGCGAFRAVARRAGHRVVTAARARRARPKMAANLFSSEPPPCSGQISVGSVPRTK